VPTTSWADGLELVGDDDRLVGFAGAVPVRLLAERSGLRAGLSAAMRRPGFLPVYDRGQLLVDLAVAQVLGAEAISDFQGLRHLAPVTGPVPSTPTVWRALAEVGWLQPSAGSRPCSGFDRVASRKRRAGDCHEFITSLRCLRPAGGVVLTGGSRAGCRRVAPTPVGASRGPNPHPGVSNPVEPGSAGGRASSPPEPVS
jgi:hypothetical protein